MTCAQLHLLEEIYSSQLTFQFNLATSPLQHNSYLIINVHGIVKQTLIDIIVVQVSTSSGDSSKERKVRNIRPILNTLLCYLMR